jgi:hypothetical protein
MDKRRWLRSCGPPLAALLVMLTCALSGYAQANRASITGTITDPQGAVVSGATVTATNAGTNVSKQTTTSDDGRYSFGVVFDPGVYTVKVEMAGFKTATSEQLVLQIGDVREVNVTLEPGGAGEVVTVTAEAPLVESETSSRGDVITGRQITELPLNGRNFTNFAILVPGVTRATLGGGQSDATGFQGSVAGLSDADTPAARFSRSGGSSLSVNGLRPSNNNFTLDGVDNNEGGYGQIAVFPPPEAIQEFKVETSVPQAEQGRGNGFINTTFRSGTNDIHGTLYYFHRNDFLDATPVFARQAITDASGNQVLPRKPARRENEFGLTLGGPVWIPGLYNGSDKTFFFFDYQGQRNKYPFERSASPFTSVPTARSRVGDFNDFRVNGACPVKDPLTGQPFPNCVIPLNRQDPVARTFLQAFDLPNAPGTFNNFLKLRRIEEQINGFDVRIDHNASDRNVIFGRFSLANQFRARDSFFTQLPAGFGAGEEDLNSRQLALGDTYSISPNTINDFRLGFSRVNIGINECGVQGRCGISPTISADLGIPNVNSGDDPVRQGLLGVGANGGVGQIEFVGDGGPFFVNSNNYHVADKVTFVRGNHTAKAGADFRVRQVNVFDGGAGPAKGFIGFDDRDTGNTQANVLLGRSSFSNAPLINGPFTVSSHEYDVFVQDDWKVSPRLTLNLGLRWDLFTNPFERHNRQGNYSFETRTIILASDEDRNLVDDDHNNFGPRIGFAYALNESRNLVVRGGWGLLYFFDATNTPPLIKNPPNGVPFAGRTDNTFSPTLSTGPPNQEPNTDPVNLNSFSTYQFVDPNNRTPYVHQYNLTVQYQLGQTWVFDVGYQGASTKKLLATRNLGNEGNGLGLAEDSMGNVIGRVKATENRASSTYNSLQLRLEKRLSVGLTMIHGYTWSHTIDETAGDFGAIADARGELGGPQNPLCTRCEKGNSSFDVRHKYTSSIVWDLPFGSGHRFIDTTGAWNKIVSGFEVSFFTTWQSGIPFSVVLDSNNQVRPDLIGDPNSNIPEGLFFNPNAFAPASQKVRNLAGKEITFGSAGRNILRGPSRFNVDGALYKNTALTERVSLQLGVQFFNLFNNVQRVVPNNSLRFNANGTVDFSNSPGQIFNAYPQRQGQLKAKLIF